MGLRLRKRGDSGVGMLEMGGLGAERLRGETAVVVQGWRVPPERWRLLEVLGAVGRW